MFFKLIERDGSAVPFEGPRRGHVPGVISIALEHQWVVCLLQPGLASRFEGKSKNSELVVPGFFKAWIWIWKEASLHPGEGQTHMLAWRSSSGWCPQFTAAQSSWQDRFFPTFDTFSADSSCQLLSYTHKKTQMTMISHLHKLANTGMRRLISCQPGDWSQKDFLNWQQILQQILYRKVKLPQQKKTTLDKCMQVRATSVLQQINTHKRQHQPPWE